MKTPSSTTKRVALTCLIAAGAFACGDGAARTVGDAMVASGDAMVAGADAMTDLLRDAGVPLRDSGEELRDASDGSVEAQSCQSCGRRFTSVGAYTLRNDGDVSPSFRVDSYDRFHVARVLNGCGTGSLEARFGTQWVPAGQVFSNIQTFTPAAEEYRIRLSDGCGGTSIFAVQGETTLVR